MIFQTESCSTGVGKDRSLGLPDSGASGAAGDAESYFCNSSSATNPVILCCSPNYCSLGTMKALTQGRLTQVQEVCRSWSVMLMISKDLFCVGWSNAWGCIVPLSSFQGKCDFLLLFVMYSHFSPSLESWTAECESWHKGQCRGCLTKRGGEKNQIISFGRTGPVTVKADPETWILTDPDQSAHTEGDLKGVEWPCVAAAAWE